MSNPYEHKYGPLMRQLRDLKFEGNDLIEDAANAIENLADEVQEMREGRNTLSAENKAIVRKLRGGELPVHLAAADAIEREAERELNRRDERRAHDRQKRRLAVDQADYGRRADLDRTERQFERAAEAAVWQPQQRAAAR